MKKILSCALALLMSAAVFAQHSDGERRWFAGAHVGTNYVVGDNISDHPAFKYFSNAVGMEGGVYVGKYLTPSVGSVSTSLMAKPTTAVTWSLWKTTKPL